jgi:hypothetical protein
MSQTQDRRAPGTAPNEVPTSSTAPRVPIAPETIELLLDPEGTQKLLIPLTARLPIQAPVESDTVEAFLDAEGRHKLLVPLTARMPVKVYGKVSHVTLREILSRPLMSQAEYTRSMQAFAEEERALKRQKKLLELDRILLHRQHQREIERLGLEIERLRRAQAVGWLLKSNRCAPAEVRPQPRQSGVNDPQPEPNSGDDLGFRQGLIS